MNKIHDIAFLKPVIDKITEGVIVLNRQSAVVAYNSAATTMLGLTEDDLLGSVLRDRGWAVIHEDGTPFKPDEFPSIITITTGQPCLNVVLGLETNQFFKWMKSDSNPLTVDGNDYVISTFSDITEQFQTNIQLTQINEQLTGLFDDLSKSESKFYNAFNYSGTGIALVDIYGKWLDVNPVICKMLGYTKEEFLNMTFQDITHPDDIMQDLLQVKRLLLKKDHSYQMEKRYFHKNGKIVWAVLSVSLVWKTEQDPDFFISQIIDITGAKEMNKQLEFKNKLLETTTKSLENRIKQVKEFNNIIAHNLRGSAGTITMLIELIQDEKDEKEKTAFLNTLSQASDKFRETLDNLMELMQNDLNGKQEKNHADFSETTERVKAHLLGPILSAQAVIKTDFEVSSVNIPNAFLESILYNLISNAVKYSKRKTTPLIEVSTGQVEDNVQLTVKDNGIGIDLEKYGNDVFKLNKTFHVGYDSKGFGLYITRNQVENAGGSIYVESEPGEGTTFKVLFPAQ